MREEELEVLITMDDPEGEPEEDTFHLQAENTREYWLDQRYQLEQKAEVAGDNLELPPVAD